MEETLPWLLALLSSESSSVERSGAALGLAEVVAVLGEAHLQAIIPGIVAGCTSKSVSVRDGNLTLLVHLPTTCRRAFEPHLEATLPCIVLGLADEAEEVRGTAMAAAMKIVDLYATSSTPLLMPVLEVLALPHFVTSTLPIVVGSTECPCEALPDESPGLSNSGVRRLLHVANADAMF